MKNTFIALFMSILGSSVSLANTPLPLRSGALKLPANVTAGLERKVIKMDDAIDGSYCTAFPITEDGYFLTALHCVSTCLVYQGLAESASNDALGLHDLFVVRNPSRVAAKCPNLSAPSLGIIGFEIVATGAGISVFTSQFMHSSPKLYEELRTQGWNSKANDYALLKAEGQQGRRLQCLKVRLAPPAHGQKIWAVGFPLPQEKKDEKMKTEPVLSASPGIRYWNIENSLAYRNQKTDEDRRWIRALYQDRGVLFSSAHNIEGQSGGPVVTQDGYAVGVTSGFESTRDKNQAEVHELIASSIYTIFRSLPSDLMETLLRKNQACQ